MSRHEHILVRHFNTRDLSDSVERRLVAKKLGLGSSAKDGTLIVCGKSGDNAVVFTAHCERRDLVSSSREDSIRPVAVGPFGGENADGAGFF